MKQQTAIVTGASEGLGKSFAIELAGRGINLILVSLPASGLPELASFIRKNFEVRVDVIETDLTRAESYPEIFDYLQQRQITVHLLINNAGLGNWAWFGDKSTAFYKTQIELNVVTPVLLTRLFLAQTDVTVTSYILNVGSLGGLFIVPKKQVYGATKSFIRYFTRCLQLELYGTNVKISLLSPGGINTKPELLVMNSSLKGISKATIMEPGQVARIAIDGLLKGKKEIVPGIANRLLVLLNSVLPSYIKDGIIRRRLNTIINA
ncbi:SDR family NAD(P)-dependent oxidoreductase [Mucilaginibacter pineti]|nr:SDR family NAD(P)-dependent oxidoreductase [Mucilaginibacter pineti]